MHWQAWGLVVFSVTVGVNAMGFGLDATLYSQGLPTVTDFARRNPWVACFIIGLNVVGLIGLTAHFSNFDQE